MGVILEVISFHKSDRRLYERLVSFGRGPDIAGQVVALWMWLELIDINLIANLGNCSDKSFFLEISAEAEAILETLRGGSPYINGTKEMRSIRLTASMAVEPLDMRFFHFNRDVAASGVNQILNGVGKFIFDDYLNQLHRDYVAAVRAEERRGAEPAVPVELAQRFVRQPYPPDDRSTMFLVFAEGSFVEDGDIIEYFTEKCGPNVENLLVEKKEGGLIPKYGRVILNRECYIRNILNNGQHIIELNIKGQKLWARYCAPKF